MKSQPWIIWDRDTNWSWLCNYPYSTRMLSGFLECKTLNMYWTCNVKGHSYICQTPSPHGTSKTSTTPWIWSAPSCSICTFDLAIAWFTWRWKKITRSCFNESPFDMGARFAFHLQEPKISSPSMCMILTMQDNPRAYFRTTFVQSCMEIKFHTFVFVILSHILFMHVGNYKYTLKITTLNLIFFNFIPKPYICKK